LHSVERLSALLLFCLFFCYSYGGSDACAAGVDGRACQVVGLVLHAGVERNSALRELEGALGRSAVAAAGHVRAAVQDALRTQRKMKAVVEKNKLSNRRVRPAAQCGNNRVDVVVTWMARL